MAAFPNPEPRHCPNCGTRLDAGVLKCPNCSRYTYAEQLQELATRARQLTAIGQLPAARDIWKQVLSLLPAGTNEHAAVEREIANLERRINPQPRTDWRKRAGPFAAILAFFAKFKGLLLLVAKWKMFFSLFAFFGVYWAMFGWWFAVGICGSIFFHEMGHYVTVRRFGFNAELPMFIPGFGAYVKWNGANVDVGTRAQISLAGPLFGFLSGLAAYGVYVGTGNRIWLAVAHFAGWLNLLNLIPLWIFDGGSAMAALGRQGRLAVALISLAMFGVIEAGAGGADLILLAVSGGAFLRMWRGDYPAEPRYRMAVYFVVLVIANGLLSWYTAAAFNQMLAPQ